MLDIPVVGGVNFSRFHIRPTTLRGTSEESLAKPGPPFACSAHPISVFGQYFRIRLEFRRKISPMVTSRFQLPGITSGYNTRTGRTRLGITGIYPLKQQPLPGNPGEPGRFYPFCSVGLHMRIGNIVDNTKQNIRSPFFSFSAHDKSHSTLNATVAV